MSEDLTPFLAFTVATIFVCGFGIFMGYCMAYEDKRLTRQKEPPRCHHCGGQLQPITSLETDPHEGVITPNGSRWYCRRWWEHGGAIYQLRS